MLLVSALLLSSGCAAKQEDAAFSIRVSPHELQGFSIPGQEIHYLVTVEESENDAVTISASVSGADVTVVHPDITDHQVAEVIVVPKDDTIGKMLDVTILGTRGAATDSETLHFEVVEGEDDRKARAEELLKSFVEYLEEVHPELNITEDTQWTGTMVSPQWLVVSHYLFFSDEWEIHLAWHVMIAPSDWARIDLRHRWDEEVPSYAFEISSVSMGTEPIPMEVPEAIWR